MPAPSRKSVALSLLLVGVGVILGLVVASDLGWLPFGHAVPDAPTVTKPAVVAPPAAGSDRNFVEVAKAVTPTVVNISTTRISRLPEGHTGGTPLDDPFFKRFFGDELFRRFEAPKDRRERSLGSGVIADANGYIITNNHVVSKADEIRILFSDKRSLTAKVVGTDPKTDIAVIKVDAKDLPTIPWADSDKLQVGEYVLAIGNPFGLNQTVTMGIVSAVGRANVGIAEYEDFIQTDAAINPGNSGGALVNARGELIGINTAIFSQSGGYMGIGFAVPSNMVRSVMDQLIKGGKVVRGYLGVSIQELTSDLARQFGVTETRGVLISDVFCNAAIRRKISEKRMKKMDLALRDLPAPQIEGRADADVTLIGWGSTEGVIREAVQQLNASGTRTNQLHFKYLLPFHGKEAGTDVSFIPISDEGILDVPKDLDEQLKRQAIDYVLFSFPESLMPRSS